MIDVAFYIFAYSYDIYRLRGFFLWVIGASILGILLNVYALCITSYPKFFYTFTVLSMVLLILTLTLNFILMYYTNSGKNPASNNDRERKLKKIFSLICLFSSFGGIILTFLLFVFYIRCDFKKRSADIFLFFLLDTWVALTCYYFIIARLIKYEMESIVQVIKENQRLEKDKYDIDSEIEENIKKNEKNKNSEVFVLNNNYFDNNENMNSNEDNKNKGNNINIYPLIASVRSGDFVP